MARLTGAARARYVRAMFGAIAPRYDLMNHIMTFGRYRQWQTLAAEIASPSRSARALDVATGTGDIAIDLTAVADMVVGVDFSRPMLLAGEAKQRARGVEIQRVEGDALALPFADNSFDCATIGFGVRNIPDIVGTLREMARVVKPGGRVVCLELTPVDLPLVTPLYDLYSTVVVPFIGGLVSGHAAAYRYLPESVRRFPDAETLRRLFVEAGLVFPDYTLLNLATIAIHWGTKPIVDVRAPAPHSAPNAQEAS
ncbi:MAG: class I SAM-dependent methyltransferase [Dehalococcoidia bacterium]|nr:class I SAM-dependent methyltransferase [Dehalococcoidia bacterium]